jgi:hypothetical protein
MKIYSSDELGIIEPINFIKNNPERFLRQNNLGLELSTNLVGDALLLVDKPVTALKQSEWWIVFCESDWILKKSDYTIEEMFSRIIPFPEAGQNSMRSEVLLTAFANDVVTTLDNEITVIKGGLDTRDEKVFNSQSNNLAKRIVAFRL